MSGPENNGYPGAIGVRDAEAVRARLEAVLFEIKRVIVGQEEMLEGVLVALLAGGHLLIEGVPGLAKTMTVKATAAALGGSFSRVQFTPDLVPADLVGIRIFRPHSSEFLTEFGPIFCNFLLADEINRAPAKVQSALLEVMQEGQATIGKESHRVPEPFLVMATQNPIESEGTYPLPEAQVDRFMMKVLVDYPDLEDEVAVVDRSLGVAPKPREVVSAEEIGEFRSVAASVYVDRALVEYAARLCAATRSPGHHGLDDVAPYVEFGASPRGSINLVRAAQAVAILRGRDYALAQDVRVIAGDVLRHRLVPTYRALSEEVSTNTVLDRILEAIPVPEMELGHDAADEVGREVGA